MNKPHKHAELIKAWADGAEIQIEWATKGKDHLGEYTSKEWIDDSQPIWREDTNYRIKPREFEEGAFYPATRRGGIYVAQYLDGRFWVGHCSYHFTDFKWVGDKLEIDWPEEQ